MATLHLPDDPNLEQLRTRARELQRAVRSGDSDAFAIIAEHHPNGAPRRDALARFGLTAAQLVIARQYGFASWPRLKHHLDVVAEFSWRPDTSTTDASIADRFLRLGCLSYADDSPARRAAARRILDEQPDIPETNAFAAAATANVDAVRRLLSEDPASSRRAGGPYHWAPIFYLAYARHDPNIDEAAVLETARLLLDRGADPNTGYLWHGMPSPFTLITGCLGEGERGPIDQPEHPHGFALARLLLTAGADPNDSQGLYNRMFRPGVDHLDLLFEFGLGSGDGGVWRARLGDQLQTPAEMLRAQLAWAVGHDMLDRVRLLVEHGVDCISAFGNDFGAGGRPPVDLAAMNGSSAILDYLVSKGAQPTLSTVDAFIAAARSGDRATVEAMIALDPTVVTVAKQRYPSSVLRAAVLGNVGAVEMLCSLGFDVNALGRRDVDVEQPWETALHHAAADGDLALARALIAHGAQTDIRDKRFNATPLGWAEHMDQPAMAEFLRPLTPD